MSIDLSDCTDCDWSQLCFVRVPCCLGKRLPTTFLATCVIGGGAGACTGVTSEEFPIVWDGIRFWRGEGAAVGWVCDGGAARRTDPHHPEEEEAHPCKFVVVAGCFTNDPEAGLDAFVVSFAGESPCSQQTFRFCQEAGNVNPAAIFMMSSRNTCASDSSVFCPPYYSGALFLRF